MIQLSAVIITFNESRNIERCLESLVDVADEIVVVDSNSTDNTRAICERFKVKFITHAFEGHIEQKNYAITQATYPHILSLDADECLDAILKKEIIAVKQNFIADGYSMNRLTNYCGQWIRHTTWYPDIKLRLWDSRKGKWGGVNPHDRFEMHTLNSKIIHLNGDILHYSYFSTEEHLQKIESFTNIAANALFKTGKKASFLKLYLSPIAGFIKNYFIALGFLEGRYGFLISKYAALATYLKYKKLQQLYMQHNLQEL